jgi:16S rRNA (guanine966-N2)-methyltransferase
MKTGRVKLIAGQYRGRYIDFFSGPSVRPTPNFVRETLFNWLRSRIEGATCLDLFAGSGALGFEALSRGAAQVVFVDRDPKITAKLKANAHALGLPLDQAPVYCKQAHIALRQLVRQGKQFDIVFLDPPFYKNSAEHYAQEIEKLGCLLDNALVYIEVEKKYDVTGLPAQWQCLQDKTTGQVRYLLYTTTPKAEP